MRRVLAHLRARWRAFAWETDAVRQASLEIWSLIRERAAPGEAATGALPRLDWPVAGRVTSRFAMRHGRLHEGIDIGLAAGTPVHAARPGVVLLAGPLDVYGNVVVLGHGGNLATVYAHLATVDVAEGAQMERRGRLGTLGATGRAFGAHLHFEVRFDGTAVDPLVFLDAPDAGAPPRERR